MIPKPNIIEIDGKKTMYLEEDNVREIIIRNKEITGDLNVEFYDKDNTYLGYHGELDDVDVKGYDVKEDFSEGVAYKFSKDVKFQLEWNDDGKTLLKCFV